MTTRASIEEMIETVMNEIAKAAGKRDLATVAALTHKAGELEEMKIAVIGIEEKLKGLKGTPREASALTRADVKLRELPVEVTQGMLNQSLLTLTDHVKRGRVRTGEELTIEAYPSAERMRTDLMVNGNKLRERGAIGRFYREAGVHAGDFVVLSEIAPNRWTLKKAAHGQYQSRRDFLNSI